MPMDKGSGDCLYISLWVAGGHSCNKQPRRREVIPVHPAPASTDPRCSRPRERRKEQEGEQGESSGARASSSHTRPFLTGPPCRPRICFKGGDRFHTWMSRWIERQEDEEAFPRPLSFLPWGTIQSNQPRNRAKPGRNRSGHRPCPTEPSGARNEPKPEVYFVSGCEVT